MVRFFLEITVVPGSKLTLKFLEITDVERTEIRPSLWFLQGFFDQENIYAH